MLLLLLMLLREDHVVILAYYHRFPLDFESLGDLSKLDKLMESAETNQLFQAFDLQERMLKSLDEAEQAAGRLVDPGKAPTGATYTPAGPVANTADE